MRRLTALALAATACLAAAAPAQAGPSYRGVQMIPVRADTPVSGYLNELKLAKKARLNLVKADISWAQLEPSPGEYSQDYLDTIEDFTRQAAKRRLKVLLLLQSTPCWTNTAPDGACGEDGSAHPPADYDAYGAAAALLAERFGSRLAAIEVWNEPDHENEEYWKGDDKAGTYAQLLRATYSRVKAADSRVQVLAGSIVGASGDFLQELYDAGIKGHYDGLSVHYYDLVLASLRSIRFKQTQNGDRKPVWLTEFGYTSCRPGRRRESTHVCVTRKEQGRFLLDIYQAVRKTRWLRAAVIYNMRDTEQFKFGLAGPTFEAKPALKVLAKAFRKRNVGRPRRIKLREGGRGVKGKTPVGDVLKLQAFRGSCRRQRRNARPRYEVVDMKPVRGRFHWKVRALRRGKWCVYAQQYWTGRSTLVDLT